MGKDEKEDRANAPSKRKLRKRAFTKENCVIFPEFVKRVKEILPMKDKMHVTHVNIVTRTVFKVITEILEDQKKISIPKFGSFFPYTIKGRMRRSPSTSVSYYDPPHRSPKFHAYRNLKAAVRERADVFVLDDEERDRLRLDEDEEDDDEDEKSASNVKRNGAGKRKGKKENDDSSDSESDDDDGDDDEANDAKDEEESDESDDDDDVKKVVSDKTRKKKGTPIVTEN